MRYPEPYREDEIFDNRFGYEPPTQYKFTVFWADPLHEDCDSIDNTEDYAEKLENMGYEDIHIRRYEI